MVSPSSTLVIDGSQIIIGPGQSILLYLGGYLPIKASGVGVNYTFVDSVVINDDFGGDIA